MKTTIYLETLIHAPMERCFDLSRSIDFHQVSTSGSGEKVVAGRMQGLIVAGETVTWEATHFFVRQLLTTKITSMERPLRFYDVMQQGAFKNMEHEHLFRAHNESTLMIDEFIYEVPYGIFGRLFDSLVLRRYMTNLLAERNHAIKVAAESDTWKRFL
jgi:ligand-binding SRPBCC domain-containing protein